MKISDITTVVTGGTPSTNNMSFWENGTIPWLQSGVCKNSYVDVCSKYITQAGLDNSSAKMMPAGTVIIALTGATVGKVGLLRIDACANQSVTGIIPNESFIPKYMFYYLMSIRGKIIHDSYGDAQPHISQQYVKDIDIPLPSLPEQECVVARIEELLSQLDTGIETLNTIKAQLAVYRQAVLKEAFAQVSYNVPFGSIMKSRLGKMLDKEKNIGVPRLYLRNINVRWFDFDLSDLLEMRIENQEIEKYSINKGDLVICEGGEPGRCAVWQEERSIFYQKALHRVRFTDGSNPLFYMYYLWLAGQTGLLNQYYTGTGIKHLTGQSLIKIVVPSTDKTTQDTIVSRIESRMSVCENIEKTIEQVLQQARVLQQSILKQAFEGRI